MQQTLQVLGGVGGFFVKLLSKVDETLEQQGIANKIEPVSKEDEADATRAEVGCASCWGRFANRYISFLAIARRWPSKIAGDFRKGSHPEPLLLGEQS